MSTGVSPVMHWMRMKLPVGDRRVRATERIQEATFARRIGESASSMSL